jgi:serine/threonine protein kinase
VISRSGYSLIQKQAFKLNASDKNTFDGIRFALIPDATARNANIKKLDHPGVLKIFEVFQTPSKLQIDSELCTGGELFERIQVTKKFSENAAAGRIKEIFSALLHSHRQGVIHRKLKPENILYEGKENNSRLKLINFGTSLMETKIIVN